MNFDHTYIVLFGKIFYEPVVILTNAITTLLCIYCFLRLRKFRTELSNYWAWFFMLIGVSACFGSMAHGVQHQLGDTFLRTVVFMVNALSLVAIYFCFKAANTYFFMNRSNKPYVTWLVIAWIVILLVITFVKNNFVLIKIHAGIVLLYSLVVHLITYFRKQPGSGIIAAGIIVSFLSILTHSIRLSFHEWFNYKDVSHVIMIISIIFIFVGAKLKMDNLSDERAYPAI